MNRPPGEVDGAGRAAVYVRMSTGRQDQSIGQQLDFIARYAAAANCAVVRIYRDEAKSGLSADRRDGLRQMMADIGGGNPGFDRVLVYDVSRWGRFQDVDESAYFEFLCSRGGVRVVYCAEQFANDGSPLAYIIKSVKRVMAAEFSRALSAKTFEAHAFLLARGFKPGGAAGFGLRRLSVRADGTVRRLLQEGERKCHPTDRVVLAPGPDAEVRTVRLIFHLYTELKLGYRALARALNEQGVLALRGAVWTDARVRSVLTNEKYCGTLVYNRSSARLGGKRTVNDAGLWLRRETAHPAIVSPEQFADAGKQRQLSRGLSREATLARLRAIAADAGTLSYRLIDAERGMPHTALIKKMFGSLARAYEMAMPPETAGAGWLRAARRAVSSRQLRTSVVACIERSGHAVAATPAAMVVVIDGQISLRIAIACCREKMGSLGWLVPAKASHTDFVLCGLMDGEGSAICFHALVEVDQAVVAHKWVAARWPYLCGVLLSRRLEPLFGLPAGPDET